MPGAEPAQSKPWPSAAPVAPGDTTSCVARATRGFRRAPWRPASAVSLRDSHVLARVDGYRAEAVLVEPLHEQHRPGRRVRVADQLLEPLRAGLDRRCCSGLPDRPR